MNIINRKNISSVLEWIIYILGYSLILSVVATIFKKTIMIDNSYYGLWTLVASIVIYILNKTIKPIIVRLTIPITALTLGIFYPFINVLILKLVDFILLNHFKLHGIFISFIAAILISIMNMIMDHFVIKPVIDRSNI